MNIQIYALFFTRFASTKLVLHDVTSNFVTVVNRVTSIVDEHVDEHCWSFPLLSAYQPTDRAHNAKSFHQPEYSINSFLKNFKEKR